MNYSEIWFNIKDDGFLVGSASNPHLAVSRHGCYCQYLGG